MVGYILVIKTLCMRVGLAQKRRQGEECCQQFLHKCRKSAAKVAKFKGGRRFALAI